MSKHVQSTGEPMRLGYPPHDGTVWVDVAFYDAALDQAATYHSLAMDKADYADALEKSLRELARLFRYLLNHSNARSLLSDAYIADVEVALNELPPKGKP